MPRSPAAPTEADPASVGSSITLRLMTIRMGLHPLRGVEDEWRRISRVVLAGRGQPDSQRSPLDDLVS
jgi:hypothetical protein